MEKFILISDGAVIEKLRRIGEWVEEEKELKIPLSEAIFLAEKRIINEDASQLLEKFKKIDELAEDKYAVMKHLRNNGYITRSSLDSTEFFRVYQKGCRPGEDRTKYIVKVVPKDWKGNLEEIKKALELSGSLRKELAVAYVEGKKINFIKLGRTNFD